LDILVTASGKSSRFGGEDKYLIDVLGAPMLHWALRSIKGIRGRKIFIALSSDENRDKVEKICKDFGVEVEILVVGATTGQAHTVKLALEQIEGNGSFLVLPVDTVLTTPLNLSSMRGNSIVTFESKDYKSFSFVTVEGNRVTGIKEKQEGDLATAGYYSFASKGRFLEIWDEIDHSQEEYISAIYQKMVEVGDKVTSKEIPAKSVVDLGTPQKLHDNLDEIFELIVAPLTT
jgi:dTDP-glucose pyrophosphorylase